MTDFFDDCRYRGEKRQCRLLAAYTTERYAPPPFCIKECGPGDGDKRAMLAREYQVELPPGKLPTPDVLPKQKGCGGCGGDHSVMKLIAQGVTRYVADQILGRHPEPWMIQRLERCSSCEHRTFLSITDWAMNVAQRAGDLPVNHTPGRFDRLWCSKCKCCIELAIRSKDKDCVDDRWDGIDPEADYTTIVES